MTTMRFPARAAVFVGLLGAAGCLNAQAKAKTPAPMPSLEVPAPPPRVLVPVTVPVPEPPSQPATTPALPPIRPTAGGTARQPDRTTPPAQPTPTPVETPPPTPTPTPVLQTTTNVTEMEKATRAAMLAAKTDLDRVDQKTLNAGARASFDTARNYLKRADAALEVHNVELAKELADKAVALAAVLVKRSTST